MDNSDLQIRNKMDPLTNEMLHYVQCYKGQSSLVIRSSPVSTAGKVLGLTPGLMCCVLETVGHMGMVSMHDGNITCIR